MIRLSVTCIARCLAAMLVIASMRYPAFAQQEETTQKEKMANLTTNAEARSNRKKVAKMSLEELKAAIDKNPKNALLYYRAGMLEEQDGNYGQALRYYQSAIRLEAHVAASYYRMGMVWEKSGEYYDLKSSDKGRYVSAAQRRRAIDSYLAAIRLRPDFSDALYRLTMVYLMGNDMQEANNTYQKLHKIEPNSDRTKQLLLMIYKRHQQQMADL